MKRVLLAIAILLLTPFVSLADDDAHAGYVRIPLTEFTRLSDLARDPKKEPRPAPAGFAFGTGTLSVDADESEDRANAVVVATVSVQVLEDEWVAIPLLPAGTSVVSSTVNGSAVQLIPSSQGLAWSSNKAGNYTVELRYKVDGQRTAEGYSLAIPTPFTAGLSLLGNLPPTAGDPVVIPSAGTKIESRGERVTVTGALPATNGFQLIWKSSLQRGYSLSRAAYRGELTKTAIIWTAEYGVDVATDAPVQVFLLPTEIALREVRVDDKPAAIRSALSAQQIQTFTAEVRGRGTHKVTVEFQVPVDEENPRVSFGIPEIPVSRLELKLPGKKELVFDQATPVTHKQEGDSTVAVAYVSLKPEVAFSWTEAVPEEVKAEVRANAAFYHTAYAEEGVLYLKAVGIYEVTRGETNTFEFEVPNGVQINKVTSSTATIVDWRVNEGPAKTVSIFVDRLLKGEFTCEVLYDRTLSGPEGAGKLPIPLLRAKGVDRQRGMVALLSTKELALKPVEEGLLTRVGENQLPPTIKQGIDKTIAHTFKYSEGAPSLTAEVTKPERKEGKFDAVVDTLVSLSDVTLKGTASVDINVKSGSVAELQLTLPSGVNFLGLTGPSIRTHTVNAEEGGQRIDVAFTQDMEGQFRLEVSYERIVADSESDVNVPTLLVRGAEVEQGKIAVEALSAVEVQASTATQLSTLDPSELPQQLVLKTTNPILLAYKYVHVSPPYSLALKITRHKEIDVQAATIDRADYTTLVTRDGLSVTTATFMVRNSRKQFLRVQLPPDSKVWSAFVDGKPEKPALAAAESGDAPSSVLIKIINSAEGFPVQIIYQTPQTKIGRFGVINAQLPRPDMVVTSSNWEVFLPDDASYGRVDSTMRVLTAGDFITADALQGRLNRSATQGSSPEVVGQLPITVPTAGRRFAFDKLYANQSDEPAEFSVVYSSGFGSLFTWTGLFALTALLLAPAIAAVAKGVRGAQQFKRHAVIGGSGLLFALAYLGLDYRLPVQLIVLTALGLALFAAVRVMKGLAIARAQRRREQFVAVEEQPSVET